MLALDPNETPANNVRVASAGLAIESRDVMTWYSPFGSGLRNVTPTGAADGRLARGLEGAVDLEHVVGRERDLAVGVGDLANITERRLWHGTVINNAPAAINQRQALTSGNLLFILTQSIRSCSVLSGPACRFCPLPSK